MTEPGVSSWAGNYSFVSEVAFVDGTTRVQSKMAELR